MVGGGSGEGGAQGVRRKVDHLGRVVIPASMRRVLGIVDGDELEVRLDGGQVLLRKPREECALCGSTTGLTDILDNLMCWSCVAAVAARNDAAAVAARNDARADQASAS